MKPTHSCHQVFCIVGSRREKKGKLFCCISVVAVVVSQSSNKIIIVNIIIKISITSRQRWPHLSWRWCSKNTNSNVANCPCALAKLFTLIISKLLAAHLLWSLSSVGLAHWCAQNYQSVPSVEQVAITNSLRSTTWGCRGWTVMGLTPPSAPHRFHLSKHVPAAAKTQSFHLTLSPYPPPPPPHLSSLFSLYSPNYSESKHWKYHQRSKLMIFFSSVTWNNFLAIFEASKLGRVKIGRRWTLHWKVLIKSKSIQAALGLELDWVGWATRGKMSPNFCWRGSACCTGKLLSIITVSQDATLRYLSCSASGPVSDILAILSFSSSPSSSTSSQECIWFHSSLIFYVISHFFIPSIVTSSYLILSHPRPLFHLI